MGYLICEKCGGYYELQEGESIDDFQGCECGGKFRYAESLDNLGFNDNSQDVKNKPSNIVSEENLERMEKKKDIEGLINLLKYDDKFAWRASKALSRIKSKKSLELLIAALNNPQKNVKVNAIKVLKWKGDKRAMEPLKKLLNDYDIEVRREAGDAIYRIRTTKPKERSKVNWWENKSNTSKVGIVSLIIIFLIFTPILWGAMINNVSTTNSLPSDSNSVDPLLNEAKTLVENNGSYLTHYKQLQNKYNDGWMWISSPGLNKYSVTILNSTNSEFIVQYEVKYIIAHTSDSNPEEDIYFNQIYRYTDKAIKEGSNWKITGPAQSYDLVNEETKYGYYNVDNEL